jgi:hypothetical protein
MRRLLAAAFLLTATALPARATEWLDCGDAENTVNFRVLLGMMDVIAVNNIEIEVKGKKWSTTPADGVTTVTKGQAFETPDQMWIDVTDENVNAIVAKLRLFKVSEIVEGSDDGVFDATGGTLQMPGVGAWAVRCSGP